jgi:hypothetical protein
MITTTIVGILVVFFAWLESSGRWKNGLKISLFIIFIFLAIRYDFGNDYKAYQNLFNNIISHSSLKDVLKDPTLYGEIGWKVLCWLFKPFGFFTMVAFISAITIVILFRFIKKYVPSKYYWFVILIYFFSPYYMLIMASAMRQELAVILYLLAIDFLIEKKPVPYLLIVIIATTLHTSAIVLTVLVVFCFVDKDRIKFVLPVFMAIFVTMLVIPEAYLKYVEKVVESVFLLNDYGRKLSATGFDTDFGLGFAFQMIIYLLLIIVFLRDKELSIVHIKMFYLFLIGIFLSYLSVVVLLSSRLAYYFFGASIVCYSIGISKIKYALIRVFFLIGILVNIFYQYFNFFLSNSWPKFNEYHTIFSVSP